MRQWLVIDANSSLKYIIDDNAKNGIELNYFKLLKAFIKTVFSIKEKVNATDIVLLWNYSPYTKLDSIMDLLKNRTAVGEDGFINLNPPASFPAYYFKVKNNICRMFKDTRIRILKCLHYENIDVLFFLLKEIQKQHDKAIICSNDIRFSFANQNGNKVIYLTNQNNKNLYDFDFVSIDNNSFYKTITETNTNYYNTMVLLSLFKETSYLFQPFTKFKSNIPFGVFYDSINDYTNENPCIKDYRLLYNALNILEQDNSLLSIQLQDFIKQTTFNDNQAYGHLIEIHKPLGQMYFNLFPEAVIKD